MGPARIVTSPPTGAGGYGQSSGSNDLPFGTPFRPVQPNQRPEQSGGGGGGGGGGDGGNNGGGNGANGNNPNGSKKSKKDKKKKKKKRKEPPGGDPDGYPSDGDSTDSDQPSLVSSSDSDDSTDRRKAARITEAETVSFGQFPQAHLCKQYKIAFST